MTDENAAGASTSPGVTAFGGHSRLAAGEIADVAAVVREAMGEAPPQPVLVFDDATGRVIDLDLRGTAEEVRNRYRKAEPLTAERGADVAAAAGRRGPGRPKLGVVAREVTLLPRHWDWLAGQPGGASVALRRLVEEARRKQARRDGVRRAQEAAYRFMTTMAGDAVGFEEAIRALFAGDAEGFADLVRRWPPDIAAHAQRLANGAFAVGADGERGAAGVD